MEWYLYCLSRDLFWSVCFILGQVCFIIGDITVFCSGRRWSAQKLYICKKKGIRCMVCYLRKDLFLCWLHLFFLLWIFLRYFSGFFMAFPRLRRVITKLKAINRVICVVLTSQKSWVIEMYVLEKRSWLQVHWTKESGVEAVDELGIMDILAFLCRLKLGPRARVWNNKSSHTFSCSLSFYTHTPPSKEKILVI